MIGDGATKLVERALVATGAAMLPGVVATATESFLEIYGKILASDRWQTHLIDPVAEELQELKDQGWRLGLCTNKATRSAKGILERLGIFPLFEALAGGDSYHVKKPHGDHLRLLLRDMAFMKFGTAIAFL